MSDVSDERKAETGLIDPIKARKLLAEYYAETPPEEIRRAREEWMKDFDEHFGLTTTCPEGEEMRPVSGEELNFCIAVPWEEAPKILKVWAHGSQVHFGSMDYAKDCRDAVRERTGQNYQVYRLVPVTEE